MLRKIINISNCLKTFEGDGIPVTRAFPVPNMREYDPFLLFDHFGPISYEPGGATGVPAHPHCGFEALTYLLSGEIEHKDSWGGKATIKTGDIQWMTTGSGLIHSELVTNKFKINGGIMHGLQIWINLPKKYKNEKPSYQHVLDKDIQIIKKNNNLQIKVLVGMIEGISSSINTFSPISIFNVQFKNEQAIKLQIPEEQIVFTYVINGTLEFDQKKFIASKGQVVFFDKSGDEIYLRSSSPGSFLVMAGEPLNEPIARYGPFVANSESEIEKAIKGYQSGEMGILK